MKIILSTRNPSKAEQIKAALHNPLLEILTLSEAKIEGEAIEDGATLEENAYKKALYAMEKSGRQFWTMADDTGIFIKALNDEPGIKASRWAGEGKETDEITKYCLERLNGSTDRSATFETCAVLISPTLEKHVFTGKVEGKITETPRTKPQPKMPYSAIFVPDGYDKSWAEMTTEEENKISHRGKAFKKVAEFLENITN